MADHPSPAPTNYAELQRAIGVDLSSFLQTSKGETAGFTPGASTASRVDSLHTGNLGTNGYTVSDIVKALKTVGILAP